MNTASEALATYREMIADVGQPIAIRRYSGTGPARSFVGIVPVGTVQ